MSAYNVGPYFSTFSRMPPRPVVLTAPTDLTNLIAWYDAKQQVYNDDPGTVPAGNGDQIHVWKDLSGNHYDLNEALGVFNNPIYQSAGLNSLPTVNNGTAAGIAAALGAVATGPSVSQVSIFAVVALNNATTNFGRIVSLPERSTNDYDQYSSCTLTANGSNNFVIFMNGTGAGGTISYATPTRVGGTINGAAIEAFVNGVSVGTATAGGSLILGNQFGHQACDISVGNDVPSHSNAWLGQISEAVVYLRQLSGGEIAALDAYFVTKWGF